MKSPTRSTSGSSASDTPGNDTTSTAPIPYKHDDIAPDFEALQKAFQKLTRASVVRLLMKDLERSIAFTRMMETKPNNGGGIEQ